MTVFEWAGAGARAAAAFFLKAWRRLWWVLAPCAVSWALTAMTTRVEPLRWGLALAIGLVASALLYRQAAPCGGGSWPGGVARQVAVWGLTVLFAGVLASLLLVVFLAAAYGVASAGRGFHSQDVATWASAVDDRGRLILGVVGSVGVIAWGWALSRAGLGGPATAALGRVQLLSTWPLTRRLGLRILVARLVLAAPAALALAVARPTGAGVAPTGALLLTIGAGLWMGGVWLPLHAGLMTYIYQSRVRVRPDTAAAP